MGQQQVSELNTFLEAVGENLFSGLIHLLEDAYIPCNQAPYHFQSGQSYHGNHISILFLSLAYLDFTQK